MAFFSQQESHRPTSDRFQINLNEESWGSPLVLKFLIFNFDNPRTLARPMDNQKLTQHAGVLQGGILGPLLF